MIEDELALDFKNNQLMRGLGINSFDCIAKYFGMMKQPHRYYHNLDHVAYLCNKIDDLYEKNNLEIKMGKEMLKLAALFHDIVYDPRKSNNEWESANFFVREVAGSELMSKEIKRIFEMILATRYFVEDEFSPPIDPLGIIFCRMDLSPLEKYAPKSVQLKNTINLFKEFQHVDFPTYRDTTIQVMNKLSHKWPDIRSGCEFCKDFISAWRPKIGIFAGSFNPFHIGHLNNLEQAENIFDKVIIAVGYNPKKEKPNIDRIQSIKDVMPFHEVIAYGCTLPELVKQYREYADVSVVRGLRSGYDLDHEKNMLRLMQDILPDIQVVYFHCDRGLDYISSSAIRDLESFGEELKDLYCPTKYSYVQGHDGS